jgi:hypothetical protein
MSPIVTCSAMTSRAASERTAVDRAVREPVGVGELRADERREETRHGDRHGDGEEHPGGAHAPEATGADTSAGAATQDSSTAPGVRIGSPRTRAARAMACAATGVVSASSVVMSTRGR